jgi:hypothetical protein
MRRVLREPLVHFLLLGAAVFGLFALFDDTPPPAAGQRITVTAEDARRLAAEFEATWRRPPEPDELDHMIGQLVREEVYVREAVALGLDQGDAVIRQRLQSKMEFLTEAGAQAVSPDDATLEAHLAAHPERFARAPLVAFEQILLDDGAAGQGPPDQILAALNLGRDPAGVARPSLLPPAFPASPPQVVDGTFGAGFFESLAALPEGVWAGPVTSPLGRHLVRVTERQAGGLPALAEIRERVLGDWRATFAAALREERFEAMRARYEITIPSAAEVLGR